MSKVSIEGNALGSGTFTIASPNSNSNRTLNLPDSSGTVVVTGGAQTIEFAAGTVSAPSITTTGDTNTGIFFPAADTIAFAEGGAEAMRIDSSGRVGIGTNSPQRPLHVNAASSYIQITNDTTGTTSSDGFRMGYFTGQTIFTMNQLENDAFVFLTNGTERMRIDSSGNVGIGTTTPLGTAANRTVATVNGTSSAIVSLGVGGTRIGSYYADATKLILGTNTSTFLEFDTNGTERARITSGGYFKASDNGTYRNATATYNDFNQSANNDVLLLTATNASYSSPVLSLYATRAANSAYSLLIGFSNDGGDTEFQLRGDGNGYADGTWQNNGADYAEYFESANGQALTLGATVVLDGGKVREATDQDPASAVMGVVRPKEPSKASMVVGNTAWNKWANKYLTDDFDRYIMEDHDVVEWEEQVLEKEATEAIEAVVDEDGNEVSPAIPAQEATYKTINHSYESHNIPEGITVPEDATVKTHDDKGNKFQHYKLNPAWDKDSEYTPREQRPEWNIIGLVGQVKVLKGQPTNDRWVKMRDVSDTVEEWFIR